MITYYFKAMPHDPADKSSRKWKLVANRGYNPSFNLGSIVEEDIIEMYSKMNRIVLIPDDPWEADDSALSTHYAPGYRGKKRTPTIIKSVGSHVPMTYSWSITAPPQVPCGQDGIEFYRGEPKSYEMVASIPLAEPNQAAEIKEIPDNGNNLIVCKNGEVEVAHSVSNWPSEQSALSAAGQAVLKDAIQYAPKKNWFRRLFGI